MTYTQQHTPPAPAKKRWHFWFSRKMQACIEANNRRNPTDLHRDTCIVEVDGRPIEREYTLCSEEFKENGGCRWDDMEYLGEGVMHKTWKADKPGIRYDL